MARIKTVSDVVSSRLCIGCGICAPACPAGSVQLFDFADEGIRPVVRDFSQCSTCSACIDVCPAVETTFPVTADDPFERAWGPVLEIWEGHASDPEIRFRGSSGGAISAIATFCVEQSGFHGVLHTGSHPEDPIRNQTRLSTSRAEILAAAGSRYSPASVCDGIALVEQAPAPCVVIGKPSEIAAVSKGCGQRPALKKNVGLTISFFCAETPSTNGTRTLLERNGVPPGQVGELRYRGHGWPGNFAAIVRGEAQPAFETTYRESWAYLQKFRPWSVQLWPDGSGELADISCGDPWYQAPDGKNPGSSLIVVRTERGRHLLRKAIDAGIVQLTVAERWKLANSQDGLLRKKGAVWGRLAALRLLGLQSPRFCKLRLFGLWRSLTLDEQLRSTFGTIRRVIGRRLYRPLALAAAYAQPCYPPRTHAASTAKPSDAEFAPLNHGNHPKTAS